MNASREDRARRPAAPEPLPGPVTDTHAHLDMGEGFAAEPYPVATALAEAAAVGVTRMMQVGCDLAGSRWAVHIAQAEPSLVAAVALHPNEAPGLAERGQLDDALAEIDALAGSSDRVRAVGETGMDRFRTGEEGIPAQEESFRAHAEIAHRRGLALAIHDRDAHDDVLRVLDDLGRAGRLPERVIFHCYSGDHEMARICADRGWFLSFAGPLTFRNAASLRAALSVVPPEQVLVETDSPFLTPHPHRGRPNAPVQLPWTVRAVADVTGRDLGAVCEQLQTTTERAIGTW